MIPWRPIISISAHAATDDENGVHPISPARIGAAREFYAEDLAQGAIVHGQSYTNSAISSHRGQNHPHQITPEMIGTVDSQLAEASFTYGSGWAADGSGYAVSVVKQGSLVVLEGMVKRTSSDPSNKTIFILPSGFRPRSRRVFTCKGINVSQVEELRVDLTTNGVVTLWAPTIP